MFPAAGKRGKRQSCQSKEPTANEWNDSVGAEIIWRNDARRHLVVATAARFSRLIDFYRLFHVGRFTGGKLFFWKLYLALLVVGDYRLLVIPLVMSEQRPANTLSRFVS